MTTWAREHDLTGADLTILTIELPAASHPGQQPPTGGGQTSGLVFSTIHLSA